MAWQKMMEFEGTHGRKVLNRLIEMETGDTGLCYESEDDFRQAMKEGWVTYENGKTVVWFDDMSGEGPMTSSKYSYDQAYIKKNLKRVLITFNQLKTEDMVLLDWLNQQKGSKVAYIKSLIEKDMEK